MQQFTCQSHLFDAAPPKIRLRGDKKKKPEAAQHIIEFPGGAIELSRTENNEYWAHIIVNRDYTVDDAEGLVSAYGEIVDSRIDYAYPHGPVTPVSNFAAVRQIAIRIRPTFSEPAADVKAGS